MSVYPPYLIPLNDSALTHENSCHYFKPQHNGLCPLPIKCFQIKHLEKINHQYADRRHKPQDNKKYVHLCVLQPTNFLFPPKHK